MYLAYNSYIKCTGTQVTTIRTSLFSCYILNTNLNHLITIIILYESQLLDLHPTSLVGFYIGRLLVWHIFLITWLTHLKTSILLKSKQVNWFHGKSHDWFLYEQNIGTKSLMNFISSKFSFFMNVILLYCFNSS